MPTLDATDLQRIAKERFGVSGTVWHVATGGNDTTGDGLSWIAPYALPSKAASVAAANDLIALGPGTFAQGTTVVTLPTGVSMVGAGMYETIITAAAALHTAGQGVIVRPGNRSVVRDLTINGTLADGTQQACFGANNDVGQTPPTFASAVNVRMIADTDGAYMKNGAAGMLLLDRCRLEVKSDAVAILGTTAHVIEVYGSQLLATGPSALGGLFATGFDIAAGRVKMVGGRIAADGGSNAGIGVFAQGSSVVEVRDVLVTSAGTGIVFDVNTGISAAVVTLSDCAYDPAKINGNVNLLNSATATAIALSAGELDAIATAVVAALTSAGVLDSAGVPGESTVEMFVGEDRSLGTTLSDSEDMTGATFAFAIANTLAEALAGTGVATVANVDIVVAGHTVTVPADKIGSAALPAMNGWYALRRTDTGNRAVKRWGPWGVSG